MFLLIHVWCLEFWMRGQMTFRECDCLKMILQCRKREHFFSKNSPIMFLSMPFVFF